MAQKAPTGAKRTSRRSKAPMLRRSQAIAWNEFDQMTKRPIKIKTQRAWCRSMWAGGFAASSAPGVPIAPEIPAAPVISALRASSSRSLEKSVLWLPPTPGVSASPHLRSAPVGR